MLTLYDMNAKVVSGMKTSYSVMFYLFILGYQSVNNERLVISEMNIDLLIRIYKAGAVLLNFYKLKLHKNTLNLQS